MQIGDSLYLFRPDNVNTESMKIIHSFPSGDKPGMLYIKVYQDRITKEEAVKLRDFINEFLGYETPKKIENLNKNVIKALDASKK